MFESIPDYRKIVFLVFIIKIKNKFLQQDGFLKSKEFKIMITEQNEKYYLILKAKKKR